MRVCVYVNLKGYAKGAKGYKKNRFSKLLKHFLSIFIFNNFNILLWYRVYNFLNFSM